MIRKQPSSGAKLNTHGCRGCIHALAKLNGLCHLNGYRAHQSYIDEWLRLRERARETRDGNSKCNTEIMRLSRVLPNDLHGTRHRQFGPALA